MVQYTETFKFYKPKSFVLIIGLNILCTKFMMMDSYIAEYVCMLHTKNS